ncbi:mannonate dehydratase (plasmid) [Haloterrigena salifodinae]|uniref:mannonate dehydratase n=1 Tax=Haloterrigena salifodinae TaxID=2675099 RepID=A0A8T8E739_9EURY|nr:mannonate dehydratase [Haloterrigena salifodinae]QRV17477.1 mannonate dehydratase [Haloterrigena salifodinae]
MQLSLVLPPEPDERWDKAKQIGVDHAVYHSLELGDGRRPSQYDELLRVVNRYRDHGLEPAVFEGSVPLTDTTRLAKDGRDDEIDEFCRFLRNLGKLGVNVVCYDWMAGLRWARTSVTTPSRGDSLTTSYSDEQMRRGPAPAAARSTTADDLWANLEYFLERVVPVAEEADVKLGLHPDDPPIRDVRGMPRIVNSPEAYERAVDVVDSPYNGITFCQGNFAAMGVDVPATIRRFGDRINFVHFRDVEGGADGFVEMWHDDGPTDMAAAIEAYRDIGFDGPIRPDHVPTMAGEDNSTPGYHLSGKLFASGYIRGLLDATD